MSIDVRVAGITALMSGLFITGCFAGHGALVKGLAQDLDAAPTPRVSRTQQPEPPIPSPPGGGVRGADITVRAWVNGKPIFDDEIMAMALPLLAEIAKLSPDQRPAKQAEVYNAVLESIIEREVVYLDAVATLEKFNAKGLEQLKKAAEEVFEKQMRAARERSKLSAAEFRDVLAKQGMSMRNLQRKIEHEFIGREYMRSRIMTILDSRIGRKELVDYYETHLNEFQRLDLVEWQDVFIAVTPERPTLQAAKQYAEEIISRVNKGEDFNNFTKYDDGDSKFRGGMGYGQRRGEIKPPELEKFLFDMADGELGPAVELSTGVHVFRVVRRERAGQISFNEEIQRQIRKKLRDDMADREYKAFVRELKTRSIIEIETR